MHPDLEGKKTAGVAGRTIGLSRRLRQVIIAVAVLVLVGLSALGLHIKHNIDYRNHQQELARIHKEILTQASKVLDAKYVAKLQPITERIKQQPDYQKDPNYLFILLKYSINLSDPVNARQYYNLLAPFNMGYQKYDPILQPYIISNVDLKQTVEFLESQQPRLSLGTGLWGLV